MKPNQVEPAFFLVMSPTKSTLVVNPLSPSAEKARCKGSLPMMMRVLPFLFMCEEEPIVGKPWEERFWKRKRKRLGA
jgi:hypothetical protein